MTVGMVLLSPPHISCSPPTEQLVAKEPVSWEALALLGSRGLWSSLRVYGKLTVCVYYKITEYR